MITQPVLTNTDSQAIVLLVKPVCRFSLEDGIDALVRYLETHGEVGDERLPELDGFQELAVNYEAGYPETELRL
jgi:hypothetical protein